MSAGWPAQLTASALFCDRSRPTRLVLTSAVLVVVEMSVCPSVRLSQSENVSKWQTILLNYRGRVVASSL